MRFKAHDAPVRAKLAEFSHLADGWYYGSGSPITNYVLARGNDIVSEFLAYGFTKLDALPVETGEVQMLAYKDEHRLSIIISDTTAEFCHEVGDKVVLDVEGLTSVDVRHCIKEAAKNIWGTCVSSTQRTTKSIAIGSATSAFANLKMAGSPSSTLIAPLARVA